MSDDRVAPRVQSSRTTSSAPFVARSSRHGRASSPRRAGAATGCRSATAATRRERACRPRSPMPGDGSRCSIGSSRRSMPHAAVGGSVEFEYLEGASYTLCDCSSCGLIFQKDIPNDALMDRLYEHWIDPRGAFDRHLAEDDLSYYAEYAQEVMQLLAYFGRVPATVSMMDFGMGWGRWAMMAKAFGCDAHGSELSADRIAYARANGVKIVEWDDIPDQRFDVINADQVFEHIANPLDTLNYLRRGLAPTWADQRHGQRAVGSLRREPLESAACGAGARGTAIRRRANHGDPPAADEGRLAGARRVRPAGRRGRAAGFGELGCLRVRPGRNGCWVPRDRDRGGVASRHLARDAASVAHRSEPVGRLSRVALPPPRHDRSRRPISPRARRRPRNKRLTSAAPAS